MPDPGMLVVQAPTFRNGRILIVNVFDRMDDISSIRRAREDEGKEKNIAGEPRSSYARTNSAFLTATAFFAPKRPLTRVQLLTNSQSPEPYRYRSQKEAKDDHRTISTECRSEMEF